ncbi:tripartite motif-containing protein 16-like [Scleropages formosus]|uniref:Tripartite motif-containing protein 16-like n=2 Tax=Scleropages formosus TaxID=113540 RepID=A0A8C9R0D0_SCLFO|nr:tripartite motif-containing protein 16-like [Scleropages formosus]
MANTDMDTDMDSRLPQPQAQPGTSEPDLSSEPPGKPVSEPSQGGRGGDGDLCPSCNSAKGPKGQVNGTLGDAELEPPRSKSGKEERAAQDAGGLKGAQMQDGAVDTQEEEEKVLGLNDVACDACIDRPRQALKSCLTCLVSYCGSHLRPHLENVRFQSHRLVEPLRDVESRVCEGHGQPLRLYCCTDGCCMCCKCLEEGHWGHEVTPVEEARLTIERELKEKQSEMERTSKAAEKAIQKLHSNTASIESSVLDVRGVIRQQFAELQAAVDKAQREVMEILEGEAQQAAKQAESIRTHLEYRCAELRRAQAHAEKLFKSKNDVDFLQDYSQWKKDAEDVSLPGVYIGLTDRLPSFSRVVKDSTRELCQRLPSIYRDKLKETCKSEKMGIKTTVRTLITANRFSVPDPKARKDFLKYAIPLSFDEKTVHKYLRLTNDKQKVTNTTPWQHSYQDMPERFEHWRQALTVESFYLGRHYFEVDVKGEDAYVGLTYKSIDRKGTESSSCIAGNDFSWCLHCNGTGFSAWHGDAETPLKVDKFTRLGVYVDFARHRLAFFGVAETMTLLFEYQAEFLEPLYPAIWLPKRENAIELAVPGDALPQPDPSPQSKASIALAQPNPSPLSTTSSVLPQENPSPPSEASTALAQLDPSPPSTNSSALPQANSPPPSEASTALVPPDPSPPSEASIALAQPDPSPPFTTSSILPQPDLLPPSKASTALAQLDPSPPSTTSSALPQANPPPAPKT